MPQPHFYTAIHQRAQGSHPKSFTHSAGLFPVLSSDDIHNEGRNNEGIHIKNRSIDFETIRISPPNKLRKSIFRIESEGLAVQNTKPFLTLDLKMVELPFVNNNKHVKGPIGAAMKAKFLAKYEVEPMSAPLLSRRNIQNFGDNDDGSTSGDQDSSLFKDLSPIRTTKGSHEPSYGDWAALNVFDTDKDEGEDSAENQEQSHTFKDESLKMHHPSQTASRDMSTDFSMEIEEGNVEMGSQGPDGSNLQSTDMILIGLDDNELSLQV